METNPPAPVTAPVLSTPESHIFETPTPLTTALTKLSDSDLTSQYEITRTAQEISSAGWTRIALQFPDAMLPDAVRVYELLRDALVTAQKLKGEGGEEIRLFILGDTSYGACCVDEIAAEHVDAQVVVHYGRSCLSPTARLPVVYVYTTKSLDISRVVDAFEEIYGQDVARKVVLVADGPYMSHQSAIMAGLREKGYTGIFETELLRDGESMIPNRTVPEEVVQEKEKLREWSVFHVGSPPTALLLTLASRVDSVYVFANEQIDIKAVKVTSALALRRRYALVSKLSTCSVYGILINTLSVKNYLHIVERVKRQIAAAGKKHYIFVVGKVNSAKIANFSEVGGWVVIGCWESSLVESGDFYVPLITPFELQLALQADGQRVWTGEWTSDFEAVLKVAEKVYQAPVDDDGQADDLKRTTDFDSEEESAPPEFDLRTGRYISHSRPMQTSQHRQNFSAQSQDDQESNQAEDKAEAPTDEAPQATSTRALVARPKGDLARVGGIVSPGAEYLRSQRTWQGLGSDFHTNGSQDLETDFTVGALVEEGRSGHASGYTVGQGDEVKR